MENSFVMLGQFRKQAREAGKSKEWIEKYTKRATSGDRDNLENVLFEGLSEL